MIAYPPSSLSNVRSSINRVLREPQHTSNVIVCVLQSSQTLSLSETSVNQPWTHSSNMHHRGLTAGDKLSVMNPTREKPSDPGPTVSPKRFILLCNLPNPPSSILPVFSLRDNREPQLYYLSTNLLGGRQSVGLLLPNRRAVVESGERLLCIRRLPAHISEPLSTFSGGDTVWLYNSLCGFSLSDEGRIVRSER